MKISKVLFMEREVDRLFAGMHARQGDYCRNPITDASFVWGVDPIGPQRSDAIQALLAREHFAANGPSDAPPLPLSYDEREDLHGRGGLSRIVKWYARSLEGRSYNLQEHPAFAAYASGVMASDLTPETVRDDPALRLRFPPRPLRGLGSGLYWKPAQHHARYPYAA